MTRYKLAFAVVKYIEFGGMQRSLLRIAQECARRGHEVHLFTASWQGPAPDGIPLHVLPTRAWTNHSRNREFGWRLQEAVAGHFDCLAGFSKLPGLDVYYLGETCYAVRVGRRRTHAYKLLPRYRCLAQLERAVFAPGTRTEILFVAPQEAEDCVDYYGTERTRLHLLPPGINRERLLANAGGEADRAALRAELGVGSEEHMILNVGSRFRTKGVDRAITALAALPTSTARLVVVGGDDPRPFKRLARALGVADRVIFPGAREDIGRFYHAADLLLHPSYTESAGATILEAMICGLPVLVTANCGFAFHVREADAGLVCREPFEQATLNRLLAQMLISPRRTQWRENARAYGESTDLYGLIERAADIIIARAAARQARL